MQEHDAQLNIINKLAHVASGSDGSTALTAANLLLRLSKPQEVFGPLFEQPEAQKVCNNT